MHNGANASRRPSSGCNGRSFPRANSHVFPPLIRSPDGKELTDLWRTRLWMS
ncbi:MAG: hypothetical protein V1899_09905 [Planctomycetota bacterium]